MKEQKVARKAHRNGIYYNESPVDTDMAKTVTDWRAHVHVPLDQLETAYKVISPYAAEKNLSVKFLEGNGYKEVGNPTVIIQHTKGVDNPQEMLSEIEYLLDEAEIVPDEVSSFKGTPIKGSKYMEAYLNNADKYGEFPKQEVPDNPFATVEINRQPLHQNEMDFSFADDEDEPSR